MDRYDVIVIGGGPGGYVAAIRASQLGLKAVVVEKEEVGGLCLNWGCIPSKALLRNAEVLGLMKRADEFGISFENLTYNYGKAVDRSRQVVRRIVTGLKSLLKKNNVQVISGEATLKSGTKVEVRPSGEVLEAANVVIATGAVNKVLDPLPVLPQRKDGQRVISTREALELKDLHPRIAIVGGGAAGVEFAYLWAAYGSQITIIELLPHLVPNEDEEISQVLEKSFTRQGMQVMTNSRVEAAEWTDGVAKLTVASPDGQREVECDCVLVAVGFEGNVAGLGLEELEVRMEGGFIAIDETMRSSVPGIYAVGDVTGHTLLAHTAFAQGTIAAEAIAGHDSVKLTYENIPRATYCQPQVASVGLTESQAREAGYDVKIGRFPFLASGKAIAMGDHEGLVKVVANAEYGEILGVHMIGPEVTELLGEVSVAQALDATIEDLGAAVHPHPTLSEALKEAALAVQGKAIHI
ncbi:MAG: dihydrolipoyl dehydrogenase [Dehalococcoidia bacterium]